MMDWRSPFHEWSRNFARLALGVAAVGVFFGIQMTLFNNFIVERLNIEAEELGWVEALREVPGLLNVVFLGLLVGIGPPLIAGLSLLVMGVGIAAYSQLSSVATLIMFSLVWSVGFHCWIPLEQSLGLRLAPAGEKGRWLGQLRSVSSIAWLLAIGSCIVLKSIIDYGGLFILAGVVTALGGLVLLSIDDRQSVEGEQRFVFKRCYAVFYALHFLQGCRKQMFITFAIFALVKIHAMPVETTMVLVLVNQILVTLSAPWLGRKVDRYGERCMLSLSYVGLMFVFLGYAVVQHRPTLYALYCLDNVLFFGGIALTTYAHRISPVGELTPNLSMGVTMNHVAAVISPLVGGYAWKLFGYQIVFYAGACLAAVSLVVSQWIVPRNPTSDAEET